MAVTTFASANQEEAWADKFFTEYVRANEFAEHMGADYNNVIVVNEDLKKNSGDAITISLVNVPTGNGVSGDNTLEGNEVELPNYGHRVVVDQLRQAVVVGKHEQQKSHIDVLEASRVQLKVWSMKQLRDLVIARLRSPSTDGITAYASVSEANRDAWVAANNPSTSNQRILFGAAKANSSGDHSADVANVDGTTDDLSPDIVSLAKRMAKLCSPAITPITVDGNGEWFIMYAGSLAFRDMHANMSTIHQNAAPRDMKTNPLFRDGDLVYNNVIIREVPAIPTISAAGAGGIDVQAAFLCGAGAVGLAYAKRTSFITDSSDYTNKTGVALAETRGAAKLTYNNLQHGVVTVYVSAVGD